MKIKISKAIVFDFIYTFIFLFVISKLNDFNNFWLIFFSFLGGTVGTSLYILLREIENETKG